MARVFVLGAGTPTPTPTRFGSAYVLQVGEDQGVLERRHLGVLGQHQVGPGGAAAECAW